MKKELIQHFAKKLHSFGYDVYVSGDGRHGFYTDGRRVVSFGGHWNLSVDFSGNYAASRASGTGWQISTEQSDINAAQAAAYISKNAPAWTGNACPVYTTPEQHLKTYGKSSAYQKFEPCAPFEWAALWDEMKKNPAAWIETTEDMYWQMLECLPPREMNGGRFLVGEADSHNKKGEAVYASFRKHNGQFFAKYETIKQFWGQA
jgi:hypothetical protein